MALLRVCVFQLIESVDVILGLMEELMRCPPNEQ